MPLLKELRDKRDEYDIALNKRFIQSDNFTKGLKTYEEFRTFKKQTDDLRAERNKLSKEFAKTKDKKIISEVKKFKAKLVKSEDKLRKAEERVKQFELTLPNWVDHTVPVGQSEDDNVAIKYVGVPQVLKKNESLFVGQFPEVKYKITEEIPHHSDLVELFGFADLEAGAKLAGARFYVEKGELALLDLALAFYTMKEFSKQGFSPLIPPYMIKKKEEEKITFFTTFEDSIYSLKEDGLLLITTSEHPMAGMFSNKIFEPSELPIRLVGFSPSFRREAGSHGKDTKGIFRTHQFHKVELHSITEKGKGIGELKNMMDVVEKVMKKLDFPYRIVQNSSGDMDKRALIQYDLEAWFPAQNLFRELHSFASVGTWVSEKLATRVRGKDGTEFVDNVYATGVAVQRTLLAILVNNFDPKKKIIRVPKVLANLTGLNELKIQEK